ncbi:NACHT domain-containing protein [Lentzea sp. NPDC004789]
MASIEPTVIDVVVKVSDQLSHRLDGFTAPAPVTHWTPKAAQLLQDLGPDAEKLLDYLKTPDFVTVVVQVQVDPTMTRRAQDQIHQGLRLAGLPEQFLATASEVVAGTLNFACYNVRPQFAEHGGRFNGTNLATAAVSNTFMLSRLTSLTEFHAFATRMIKQVAALHGTIRMPHIGVSRAVPYDRLYVRPDLQLQGELSLGVPGDRTVVLGDPGAGKSTLAAKFAHDIALDGSGRVPFLLMLREFTTSFSEGGHDLLHYLEMLSQAPYNVKPPENAVEYLLRNGRAVLVLDGLDEIVQTEQRRRVVALVEGFAHLYPTVPVLVTARKIGYDRAPLDSELFTTAHILEFTEELVRTYVGNWFVLDDSTSPAEQKQLAASFMEDSEQIPELRSNPLLLTLLCAMYSSDRYLPRNLAQVYERCALMLFEQWDAKRGIDLPLSFEGRLRGAVQHLAWRMFTAPESGKAQSRTRIVRMLTEYLETKLDDHDEAAATAARFLAYCTGRAWILTDVGATRTEPQYGFTHRTFLEYFAAEHLVRTHRTAAELWAVLRPNVEQWDVVAQIALQLYDRNIEGGVDELLLEALDNDGLAFAARSLQYVHPATRTVRAIASAALNRSAEIPVEERIEIRSGANCLDADQPLMSCVERASAANRSAIEQGVAERLQQFVQEGLVTAALMLDTVFDPTIAGPRWQQVRDELIDVNHDELVELWTRSPWAAGDFALNEPGLLTKIVQRSGVLPLYRECLYGTTLFMGAATLLMELGIWRLEAAALQTAMASAPTPWFESTAVRVYLRNEHAHPLPIMLSLPAREMQHPRRRLPPGWLDLDDLTPEVREFLLRWERGEISVLAPSPEPPPPPPAQR